MAVTVPLDGAGTPPAPPRQAWIDTLRVAVVTGVIGAQVSLIYAPDVGWYYEERTASSITEAILAGLFAPGSLFGMGLMFFVAGLFTPGAFAGKGARRVAVDRSWRLGLPAVAYLLVVNPAMGFAGDKAVGSTTGFTDYLGDSYRGDIGFGVAWFLAALSVFSLAYAAWRSRHPARPEDAGPLRAASSSRRRRSSRSRRSPWPVRWCAVSAGRRSPPTSFTRRSPSPSPSPCGRSPCRPRSSSRPCSPCR